MTLAFYILFATLILLNIADTVLTARILARGGTELNPLMNRAMDAIGVVPALVVTKALALGFIYYLLTLIPLIAHWVALFVVAGYVYLVWHNWKQYRR